jgi:C-terminal processing protease CtpA/Prc
MAADDVSMVASALRGEEGTEVVLVIRRADVGEIELTIVRDVLPVTSAGAQHLAGDIGYLHITRFADDTPELVAERLSELSSRGARGIILDLRGNSSGRPSAAVSVVDLDELVSKRPGFALQIGQHPVTVLLFIGLLACLHRGGTIAQHTIT